ncbi:MAG: UDP-2,3-diacylglucosamine diphosphatase LpxI [Pseudomonadota bacterium]
MSGARQRVKAREQEAPVGGLGVIAGNGALPKLVAEAAVAAGEPVHIIGLRGASGDWISAYPHTVCGLGQAARLFAALRAHHCSHVCFAGGLSRPSLSSLRFDTGAFKLIGKVRQLMRLGDDGLLRGLAAIFEDEGFSLVGAERYLSDLLAPEGALGRVSPNEADRSDIERAAAIVDALGRVDVGQAAIVARGRCLGLETVSGTDAMLQTLAGERRRGGAPVPSGCLFKAPKPGQDQRLDLPTIGPATIPRVQEAGLNGIAVAAGQVFVIDPAETVAAADRAGLFLFGWRGQS